MLGLRAIWQRKAIPITLALVYMIQIGANLLSGHGALENGQNFTAYITFHGMMNWWHIPPDVYSFSVVNQFFKDPIGFIELFIPLFLALIIYALPALLGLFVFKNSLEKKFAWFVLISTSNHNTFCVPNTPNHRSTRQACIINLAQSPISSLSNQCFFII